MTARFLHTADWQFGKPFAFIRDNSKRHRVQQERLHAIQWIANLAGENGATFVLVAGDLFDSSHATKGNKTDAQVEHWNSHHSEFGSARRVIGVDSPRAATLEL